MVFHYLSMEDRTYSQDMTTDKMIAKGCLDSCYVHPARDISMLPIQWATFCPRAAVCLSSQLLV